jgi:hypothetical protein
MSYVILFTITTCSISAQKISFILLLTSNDNVKSCDNKHAEMMLPLLLPNINWWKKFQWNQCLFTPRNGGHVTSKDMQMPKQGKRSWWTFWALVLWKLPIWQQRQNYKVGVVCNISESRKKVVKSERRLFWTYSYRFLFYCFGVYTSSLHLCKIIKLQLT